MQPKRQAPADEREGAIHEVDVELYAVLGQATMLVSQLLKIGRGAIIELEQKTTDPVELQVNPKALRLWRNRHGRR